MENETRKDYLLFSVDCRDVCRVYGAPKVNVHFDGHRCVSPAVINKYIELYREADAAKLKKDETELAEANTYTITSPLCSQ